VRAFFQAVPLDKKQYGTFYSGDSYLVLETVKTKYGRLDRNLFFWLGKDSSRDERGAAAYKVRTPKPAWHETAIRTI
jgi:gelsolin